jgi:hypothetical protein
MRTGKSKAKTYYQINLSSWKHRNNTNRDWVLLVDHANYSNSLAYTEPEKWTTICSEPSRKYAAKDLNVKVHS